MFFVVTPKCLGDLKLLKINRLLKQKFIATYISKTFARGPIDNSKKFQEVKKKDSKKEGFYYETEKIFSINGNRDFINNASAGSCIRKCGR